MFFWGKEDTKPKKEKKFQRSLATEWHLSVLVVVLLSVLCPASESITLMWTLMLDILGGSRASI